MKRSNVWMEKVSHPANLEKPYSNRRDNIVKKSAELSVLCDVAVGLLMFSPSGELTSYASKGRVEDVFLRFVGNQDDFRNRDIGDKEMLSQGLRQTKREAEMLDIIEKMQALEGKLFKLDKQKIELQEKLRYYNPAAENISSVEESELHEQLLYNALQRVDDMIGLIVETHDEITAEGLADSQAKSNQDSFGNGNSSGQHSDDREGECLQVPHGPYLGFGFFNTQTNWKH